MDELSDLRDVTQKGCVCERMETDTLGIYDPITPLDILGVEFRLDDINDYILI